MTPYQNPFPLGSDQHALWHLLVEVDIESFVQADWARLRSAFVPTGFTAIDAKMSFNPDDWRLSFSRVDDYGTLWLENARAMGAQVTPDALRQAFIDATRMDDIEVHGDSALLHKQLDGQIVTRSGTIIPLHWQTLYQCVRLDGEWKIAGFVGFLPLSAR
ncbi:MAG: hypothetical protein IPO91_14180 [Chloroflexi bacterium]|nr:hypothetical protein [Chloroflexota bacterium]